MKRITILLALFSLIALSCDKITPIEDEIVYRKYSPYLVLKPADSVGQITVFQCEKAFPYPSDSSVSVNVDLDKDGIDDFSFTYTTRFLQINAMDSCENYRSKIEMKSLDLNNSILVENTNNNKIRIFNEDNNIPGPGATGAKSAIIHLDEGSASTDFSIEDGNKYIGVNMYPGGYGWIKVFHQKDSLSFTIMEHAFNATFNLNIKAGQKK